MSNASHTSTVKKRKRISKRSWVLHYFISNRDESETQCSLCNNWITYENKNTACMISHLKGHDGLNENIHEQRMKEEAQRHATLENEASTDSDSSSDEENIPPDKSAKLLSSKLCTFTSTLQKSFLTLEKNY